MKITALALFLVLNLGAELVPAQADAQPTAFEKALYDRARYRVVCRLNDEDFASYCVSMNIGGETLLKFHDEILAKQTELADLLGEGLSDGDPRIVAANAALKDLRTQYAVKIAEARKGLEVESKIADETLSDLSQYQK
jgi:hypothetical protein